MKSPFKEVLIAFIVGALVGWFAAGRNFEPPAHGKRGDALVEKFSRRLQLTPEQKEKVRAIFEDKRGQFRALREEMRPRFEAIRASSRQEIRSVLSPGQIPAFEKMEAEWQARREKMRDRWHS